METKNEDMGGSTCSASPIKNEIARPINVSYPALCAYCIDQFRTFVLKGHQDDGERFACGIMVDNMRAGNFNFHCQYFSKKPIAPIIDADSHPFGYYAGRF